MEDTILANLESLSINQLRYEIEVRQGETDISGVTVDDLVTTLQGLMVAESMGTRFEGGISFPTESLLEGEISECRTMVAEITKSTKSVLTSSRIGELDVKFWHVCGRLNRLSPGKADQQAQIAGLLAQLEQLRREFEAKARFFRRDSVKPWETSFTESEPGIMGATSLHVDGERISKWGIRYKGDKREELGVCEFIQAVEDRMKSRNVSERELMMSVKELLDGDALLWYRLVESRVKTWGELRSELRAEFLPYKYTYSAWEHLTTIKQREQESMSIFIARFTQQASYFEPKLPEQEQLRIIRKNILPDYQEKLWDKEVNSVAALLKYARDMERCWQLTKEFTKGERQTGKGELREKFQGNPRREEVPKTERDLATSSRCNYCNKSGHWAAYCPTIKCFRCGANGHMGNRCKQRQGN